MFAEQRAEGGDVWQDPFTPLRLPKIFDLRADPFERTDREAYDYMQWRFERLFLLTPAQAFVGNFLKTCQEFPPRQSPAASLSTTCWSSCRREGPPATEL